MQLKFLVLLYVLMMVCVARADEHLPVLCAGGVTYSNVLVTSVSASDVFFSYNGGMGNVKLSSLDPALQQHFHYDAAKSATKKKSTAVPFHFRVADPASQPANDADRKVELADAVTKVKVIVNQPVTSIPLTSDIAAAYYSPGWFHAGANRPDFAHVDIRTTQELVYTSQYVTSDLNPGVVFPGAQLEFNANTKYFYTDRTVPKKKLTAAEMEEINRLYRIIGEDADQLHATP